MQATWRSHSRLISLSLIAFVSYIAWYISYTHGLSLIYNDAMSHLDLARLVVDNQQTGLSQLGGVWLPLSQLVYLPLIWNSTLWHSGIAGSIISMAAYVGSVAGIYMIITELGGRKLAAVAGAIVLALNLNLLYLQSTPLTEPLYVALFIFSSLSLIKYLKSADSKYLLPLGIFTALQVADRYDGWFVAVVYALSLAYYELRTRRLPIKKALGSLVFYAFPVVVTMVLWFAWNLVIFHNALYSFTGPYSAHAQQAVIEHSGGLITKGNLVESIKAFGYDVIDNIGSLILGLAALGWIAFFTFYKKISNTTKLLTFAALLSVIVFNIVALYLGFSILNIPQLHWNPSGQTSGTLFNARYGILALPIVAVGAGLLVAQKRKYQAVITAAFICAAVVIQMMLTYHSGIITVDDGLYGSSAFVNQDMAHALQGDVKGNQTVLMSFSSYNAVAFQSGLPLHQFIQEGVSGEWNAAVTNPDKYAQWIVIPNGNVGDPVYTSLIIKEKSTFLKYYQLKYKGAHANLYERRINLAT